MLKNICIASGISSSKLSTVNGQNVPNRYNDLNIKENFIPKATESRNIYRKNRISFLQQRCSKHNYLIYILLLRSLEYVKLFFLRIFRSYGTFGYEIYFENILYFLHPTCRVFIILDYWSKYSIFEIPEQEPPSDSPFKI